MYLETWPIFTSHKIKVYMHHVYGLGLSGKVFNNCHVLFPNVRKSLSFTAGSGGKDSGSLESPLKNNNNMDWKRKISVDHTDVAYREAVGRLRAMLSPRPGSSNKHITDSPVKVRINHLRMVEVSAGTFHILCTNGLIWLRRMWKVQLVPSHYLQATLSLVEKTVGLLQVSGLCLETKMYK